MSAVAGLAQHDVCVMCNAKHATPCVQCKSTWYCSSKCQQSDRSSHELLCKKFTTQTSRPSTSHRRAICFPTDDPDPQMICLPATKDIEGMQSHKTIKLSPYLGTDSPLAGTMRIEHNPVRCRNLGSGMAFWAPQTEGYSIAVIYRDRFLSDGSTPNTSVLHSVSTSGIPPHPW